ncbi:RHS repeat domain-containing protein [Lunatibacter salilacus]|uniref:RHS repeat domain-containing protein n=1 Tax=Lunatibacter salilacus TaxID=2483804 RepID=UPI00131DD279|nr:RHS repeat domain-containing protein [Lunatibacter salilacus]
MKKVTLFLIFNLSPLLGFAQSDPLNFDVAPTSPNAYAFSKYVEIPESSYTGLVPISIPIGSISEKGASVDITLSYHASGIKVDEIASWVGLGWSLNAGGVITREERHKAERPDGNGNILPTRLDIGFPDPNPRTGRFDNLNIFFDATRDGNFYDIEPDIFYYNFGNRNGKFVFDENGDVQFYKYEDLKIEFVKSNPSAGVSAVNSKFIVTDETGTVYEFDEIDRAFAVGLNELIPTSWYLTKIESPQGGEITFNYTTRVAGHFYNQKTSLLIDEGDDIDNYGWPAPVQHWSTGNEVFLESISTPNSGKIEFTADTSSRLDYRSNLPGYALREISFYDLDNVPIKHVSFSTGYFIAPAFTSGFAGYRSPNLSTFEHLRYRLKLDAITFFAGDKSDAHPPYKFEYYSDVNGSLFNLPHRLSVDQDHWGYFNNAGNRTLIPGITWTVYAGQWFERILNMKDYSTNNFKGGANREGSATAVKACSLHKVVYPTGGYTVYNLEPHDFDDPEEGYRTGGGLRIGSIANHDNNGLIVNQKTYIYKNFDPSMDPPFISGNFSSGQLISDPRDFYVLLGRGYGPAQRAVPPGDIGSVFGDWSNVKFIHPFQNVVKISTVPQAVLGSTRGQAVGYRQVIEFEGGNGYRVSTYTTSSTYPNMWNPQDHTDIDAPTDIFDSQYSTLIPPAPGVGGYTKLIIENVSGSQFPFLPMYDTDWKRGHLESVRVYSESKHLLYKKDYEYFFPNLTDVFGYKVYEISGDNSRQSYIHGKYYLPANWVAKKKETSTHYGMDGSNSRVTVKEFEYAGTHHKFPTLEKSTDSEGGEIQKKYYYPQDYNNGVENISALKNNHIIGKAVKTEILKGGNLTEGTVHTYNNRGDPVQVYNYENESLIPPPTHNPGLLTPPGYQKKASYVYDPLTHLLRDVVVSANPHTSYIWNGDYRYPTAKAENALSANIAHTSFETSEKGGWDYSGSPVPSANSKTGGYYYNLGTGSISKTGIGASTANKFRLTFWARRSAGSGNWAFMGRTESLTTAWKFVERDVTGNTVTISGSGIHVDELRLHPAEAQMTTYTHVPQVGVKSVTDARNYTVHYDYDAFGRLKTVKDENGQIIEHYQYNYQTSGLNP